MLLNSLELFNFRNYKKQKVPFQTNGAIITGENGTGKTNLLEAVYYLAFGKSFRTAQDSDLIRFGEDYFRIVGHFMDSETKQLFEIQAAADRKQKICKINGVTLEKISILFSYLQTVYFSQTDQEIINGTPAKRRHFLDQATAQFDLQYLTDVRLYRQVLRQRNALLKTSFSNREKKSWDEQFVEKAEKVCLQRIQYLKKFIPLFRQLYAEVLDNHEIVDISYSFSYGQKEKEFSAKKFSVYLQKMEKQEKLLQRSLAGPHLDDLNFILNGKFARNYASQGQTRSLAIIARITQALIIYRTRKKKPLLMFDDVLSELDANRRSKIINIIRSNYQILIATPDVAAYKSLALPVIELDKIK